MKWLHSAVQSLHSPSSSTTNGRRSPSLTLSVTIPVWLFSTVSMDPTGYEPSDTGLKLVSHQSSAECATCLTTCIRIETPLLSFFIRSGACMPFPGRTVCGLLSATRDMCVGWYCKFIAEDLGREVTFTWASTHRTSRWREVLVLCHLSLETWECVEPEMECRQWSWCLISLQPALDLVTCGYCYSLS